jgi:hypothetical protein
MGGDAGTVEDGDDTGSWGMGGVGGVTTTFADRPTGTVSLPATGCTGVDTGGGMAGDT